MLSFFLRNYLQISDSVMKAPFTDTTLFIQFIHFSSPYSCFGTDAGISLANFNVLASVCSTAVVGLLYPCLDSHLGEPHKFKREWASVMRCIAVFVGINHASVVSFRERLAVVVKNVVNVLLNLIQQDVQV